MVVNETAIPEIPIVGLSSPHSILNSFPPPTGDSAPAAGLVGRCFLRVCLWAYVFGRLVSKAGQAASDAPIWFHGKESMRRRLFGTWR
jgi:hypothetical protein